MKKYRNPPPTIDDVCWITGSPYAELHEVYLGNPGSNLSKHYRMQIRLSRPYHNGDSRLGIHHNKAFKKIVQHIFQLNFADWYEDVAFYDVFKQNYLLCETEIEDYAKQLPEGVTLERLMELRHVQPNYINGSI